MASYPATSVCRTLDRSAKKRRSTELKLITSIHDIASSLQQNKSIHAAVLDFYKAFEVPHQRLLMNLESYGIHGNLLSWMESFLTKRVQSVICEGTTSTTSPVTSGVPQESVLGPLLFLTYINDLQNGLTSTVKLFADDTLLCGVVVEDSDFNNLQDDLNRLETWQHEWQMQFNPSKSNVICILNTQSPPQRTYFFCGSNIEQVDSLSYLGMTVNSRAILGGAAFHTAQNSRKNRQRNVIWFNPPYSMNVQTNIGREFLKLVIKHFPKNHRYSKIFNKNNIKVNYSCTDNLQTIITEKHNRKILETSKTPSTENNCNCRKKNRLSSEKQLAHFERHLQRQRNNEK